MTELLSFSAPPIDEKEVFRYARGKKTEATAALFEECVADAQKVLTYKVVYSEYPVRFFEESADNGLIDLCFTKVYSKDLYKNLVGCKKTVLFAATVGVGMDRLILSCGASPSKALLAEALGSERAEALAEEFNERIKEKYLTAPRFSPGYGDLALGVQKAVFDALDCKRIGLYLNDSLIMSPSKSITAIIGIKGDK